MVWYDTLCVTYDMCALSSDTQHTASAEGGGNKKRLSGYPLMGYELKIFTKRILSLFSFILLYSSSLHST